MKSDGRSRASNVLGGGFSLLIALVCLVLAPVTVGASLLGTLLFGGCGVWMLFRAAMGFSGRAPCPSCGAEMRNLPANADGDRCGACGQYARCVNRTVVETPADFVAKKPIYRMTIEPGLQPAFPRLCADCGAPATQTIPQPMSKTTARLPGVGRRVANWTVQLPCCAAHRPQTEVHEGFLRVKSHRFWLGSVATAQRTQRPAA